MRAGHTNPNEILREVEELEDAYVEAFIDKVDAASLSRVWDRIKFLRSKIEGRGGNDKEIRLSQPES